MEKLPEKRRDGSVDSKGAEAAIEALDQERGCVRVREQAWVAYAGQLRKMWDDLVKNVEKR